MAHIYLCRPQSQVRALGPSRPNTYLDEVVRQTCNCGDHPSYTALIAAAGATSAPSYTAAIRPSMQQQQQSWSSLTGQVGCTEDAVQTNPATNPSPHQSLSPSSLDQAEECKEAPSPPSLEAVQSSYAEAAATQPSVEAQAEEHAVKLLHVQSHPPPAAAATTATTADTMMLSTTADNNGEVLFHSGTAVRAPPATVAAPRSTISVGAKKKMRRRARQAAAPRNGTSLHPSAASVTGEGNANRTATSSFAFAQRFLVEYEALSRRDIIIDFYAGFPQPAALPSPAVEKAPSATASRGPLRKAPPRQTSLCNTDSFKGPTDQNAEPHKEIPCSASWCHCRLVFPGSLWDEVLRQQPQLLQHALVSDAAAALSGRSVDVRSLHASPTELEVILSVRESARPRVNADAVMRDCAFGAVWEVYKLASSVYALNAAPQHAPAAQPASALLPLPRPLPLQPTGSVHESQLYSWREDEDENGAAEMRVVAPSDRSLRVGGAPWRQTRRRAGRHGDGASAPAELVVPIVFATVVTDKLRRAARRGANGDLHVALRRDGLYAVPSAQEVRVRATRVNADGLYAELVFRWSEGEAADEHAEEAMDEAPFADTWKFLEDCQLPTTSSVTSTVVKHDGATKQLTDLRHEDEQQHQQQQQQQQVASLPLPRAPHRAEADMVTREAANEAPSPPFFPTSFPRLASLSPTAAAAAATTTATTAPQRVPAATSTSFLFSPAMHASNVAVTPARTTQQNLTQATQTELKSPMEENVSTISESFCASGDAAPRTLQSCAATQTSLTASRQSPVIDVPLQQDVTALVDAPAVINDRYAPLYDGVSRSSVAAAAASLPVLLATKVSDPHAHQTPLKTLLRDTSSRSKDEAGEGQSPGHGSAAEQRTEVPAEKFHDGVTLNTSEKRRSVSSMPAIVTRKNVRPYVQGGQACGVSPVSFQVTEAVPFAWHLCDQPSRQCFSPETHSVKTTPALFSTHRPNVVSMVRRRATDCRAVLNGSIKAVSIAVVESLPSPACPTNADSSASYSSSSSSNKSLSSVLSSYHVVMPGSMWSTIVSHRHDAVAEALAADMAELLADNVSSLSVEAITVQDGGGLRVNFTVPLSALPSGVNPPQFRCALERLPMMHLHRLHDDAATAARVPTTLHIRRFFNAPALTEEKLHAAEETLRTLIVAETCALLDTSDDNVLQLTLAGHLTADVTVRVPRQALAEGWQKTLMEHDYPALTDFLAELTAEAAATRVGETEETTEETAQATQAVRRATLLLTSSSMLSASEEEVSKASRTNRTASREAGCHSGGGSSSAHAMRLDGPLWPTVLADYGEELHKVLMSDITTTLSPLSVTVERLSCAPHERAALLTFLLRSHVATTGLHEVEDALQGCPFIEATALYTRVEAERDNNAKAEAVASSTYTMQLDGEAWLEVLAKHKSEMTDTFALEALSCLRGNNAVTVPVGVSVKELVPRSAGVLVSYNVVSSAAADAVDRFRVAEVVEQHAFPLLWELYDAVMLSRSPFRNTTNPHWIAARRQRLLSTAYGPTEEPPNPRSYTCVGYADEVDLESYLQQSLPHSQESEVLSVVSDTDARVGLAGGAVSATPPNVQEAVGQEEYEFKHLPAPWPLLSMTPGAEKRSSPLPMPELEVELAQRQRAAPPVLSAALAPAASHVQPHRRQRKKKKPTAPQERRQVEARSSPGSARPLQSSDTKGNHDGRQVEKNEGEEQLEGAEVEDVEVVDESLLTEEKEDEEDEEEFEAGTGDSNPVEASLVAEEEAQVVKGRHELPVHSPSPTRLTVGPVVIAGTLTLMTTRPPEVKPAPAPARAKSVVRIPVASQVVIPWQFPAAPSRKRVDAPELTSARQIEAPVRLRVPKAPESGEGRPSKNAAPMTEVVRQLQPIKVASRHEPSASQWKLALPRLDGRDDENRNVAAPQQGKERGGRQPSCNTVGDQAPALCLPQMNRHSTAPITVVEVRMTHPPLVPPASTVEDAKCLQLQQRSPRTLTAGVSLASVPLLAPGRSRSNSNSNSNSSTAPSRGRAPSKVAAVVFPSPTLPVLHTSTSSPPFSMLTLPPTNRPRAATPLREGLTDSVVPAVQDAAAANPAARVTPPWVRPPQQQRQQSRHSPLSSPRLSRVVRANSVKMGTSSADVTPPRLVASFFSPPLSFSHFQSTSAFPVPLADARLALAPAPVVKHPSFSSTPPDMLSNGPSASQHSRTSPSLSPSSSLLLQGSGSAETRQRRTDPSAVVAVTTPLNDRYRTLWQDLSAVDHSVRARYPRMERELMAMAHETASSSPLMAETNRK